MTTPQELDKKQFFQPVVETISQTLGLPACIWLADKEGKTLSIAAAEGLEDNYVRKAFLRLDEPCVAADVFATGQTIVVTEIASDDRWKYKPETTAMGLKSAMVVPLRVKEKIVGVLDVYTYEVRDFSDFEKALIEGSAAQVAATQRRIRDLATLNEVSLLVSSELRRADLFQRIVQAAERVLDCKHVSIFLADESGDLVLKAASSPGIARKRFAPGEGLAGWVTQIKRSELVPDAVNHPKFASGLSSDLVERSMVLAPIILEDRVIGVISADMDGLSGFDEHDQMLLEAVASQAAVAVHNARLLEQATSRAAVLQRLQQIGGRILSAELSAQGLREVLHQVARSAKSVLGADLVDLYQYIEVDNRYVMPPILEGERRDPTVVKDEIFEDDVVVKVVEGGKPLYSPDAQAAPLLTSPFTVVRPDSPDKRFVVREGVLSSAAVPLKAVGETVGVMFVNYRTGQAFTSEQRGIIELFASQAALAIRNVRLYESIVRSATETEKLAKLQSDLLAIGPDTRLSEVLTVIAETANEVLGGHFCVVQPYDQSNDRFLVDQFTPGGAPEAKAFKWTEPREDGTARTALNEGRLIVEDYDKEVEDRPFLAKGPGALQGAFRDVADIKASLGIRLEAGGERVGVLFVNYPDPHYFTEEEKRIAELFASQAALAIRNVRLLSERISEEVEHLLLLMREVDEWIVQRGGDKTQLAEFTLTRFLDLFRFGAAWLLLMEGQQLRIVATDPQHVEDKGRLLRLDASITGLAAREKRTVKIDNIETAEPYLRALYQPVHGGGMRSELAAPMMVGDRVIGVLNLESSEPAAFTPFDQELLETLARDLGVAIVAAEEMHERATLGEMAIEFSGSLEEEETAKLILNRALELIGGEFGQILTREKGEVLDVKWATGGEGVGIRLRVDDCASGLALLPRNDPYLKPLVESGAVILSGRSVIIPDVDKVVRYKRVIEADKERMQSELAIPVMLDGKVVGVFNVESPKLGAFTSEKETALAEFVQEHANEIGEALRRRTIAELKKLMQQGLDIVSEEFGQILRLDEKELVIEHTEGDEPPGTRVEIRRLESGQWAPITGRAAMERRIVNVPDVSKAPGYLRFLGEEVKSELVVPLVVRGETIGVINFESPVPGYFTEEHVALLEPMASHAAAAMANARAVRDRELAAVGEKSGDIVHRLSNPTGAIRWRLERLQEKEADLINSHDYLAKSLADIERNALKIQGMVRELKESAPELLAPFEVWPLLTSALGRIEIPSNIELISNPEDSLPRVLTNQKLEDVFYNLMINAVEAMPEGGRLEIITEVKDQDWVEASIRDTGRGIPDYLLEEIFTASFTTKGEEGHGLGLWWSKAFAERCGGTIEVQSELGKGSCFTVRLQVAR